MTDLSDGDLRQARQLAEEIADDPQTNRQATIYASALAEGAVDVVSVKVGSTPGTGIEHQLKRIQGHVNGEYATRISKLLGEHTDGGYTKGYCQICGDRDGANAVHSDDAAHRKLCESCYHQYGEPEECDKCGAETFEGDHMVSGPHEGKYFCNGCLMRIPTGPPGDAL